jgi:hypothetical protein
MSTRRLVDEALTYEPVRNTFRLGWEFIRLNPIFALSLLLPFMLFLSWGLNPFLSMLFFSLAIIWSFGIHIYVAKLFYRCEDMHMFVQEVQKSTIEHFIKTALPLGLGAFLAWTLMLFLLAIVFVILLFSLATINQSMALEPSIKLFLILPFFLFFLFFWLIHPIIQSNVALSENMFDALFAVYSFLFKNLWKDAFQKEYLFYILMIAGINTFLVFGFYQIDHWLNHTPVMMGILFVLKSTLVFVLMVVVALSNMMARRIVDKG